MNSELDKGSEGTALEALDSVIMSHREGDLGEWELQIVRSRLVVESAKARSVVTLTNEQKRALTAVGIALDNPCTENALKDALRLVRAAFPRAYLLDGESATTPAATERQQVDAEHRICQHGRDAFADDCGMCELAGTNWAAPSAESSSATVCPAAKAMPDSPGFMTCCDQMRAGSRTDCTRSPCVALSATEFQKTIDEIDRAKARSASAHNDHPLRHFDRTCPACLAEEEPTERSVSVPPTTGRHDLVTVREDVIRFLLGEAAFEGYWYGDMPAQRAKFWWRTPLRVSMHPYTPSATESNDSLDGRRYRWLQRQECGNVCGKGGPDEDCYLQLNPRDMDAAIDAALESEQASARGKQ